MATSVTSTGITFPDATTQTTAYVAGGGVSSLNGQTGAVDTTSTGAVGSTMMLMYSTYSDISQGATVAGSTLYRSYSCSNTSDYGQSWSSQQWISSGYLYYGGGGTTMTGTWRKMSGGTTSTYSYGCCYYVSRYWPTLFIRVS